MNQYRYASIDGELVNDERQGIASPVSSSSDSARFEELHEKYFSESVLSGSG